MYKLHLKTILLAITMAISSFAYAQNDLKAQIEFSKAETAYQDRDYRKALEHLTESENLLGFFSGKISYLKIEILEKLADFKTLDNVYLVNLTKEVEVYMDYANKNADKVPIEKLTNVYDLEQKIKKNKVALEVKRREELEKKRIVELEAEDPDFIKGLEAFKVKNYNAAKEYYLSAANKGNGLARIGLQNVEIELTKIAEEKKAEEDRRQREEKRKQEEKIREEQAEAQRIIDKKKERFFYTEKRASGRFLLNGGIGTGKLIGSDYEEGLTSWYAGFGSEKDISKRLSYQFELLWHGQGDWIGAYESLDLTYMSLVPVGFNYYIWKNKNFGALALESNLYASYLLSSKASSDTQGLIDDELINEYDFGYSLGFRLHYNWINIHLRLSNGLMEIWKKDAGLPSMKNSNLTFGIGFSF